MRRFNPEKELRKIQHGGRNRIIAFVFILLIVSVISYSFALYQVRYSKRIIYTKVAPFSSKDIELAVNIKGEGIIDTFPTREEAEKKGIKFTGLECDKDGITTATWDEEEWLLDLKTKEPNKCTVNFGKTLVVTSHGSVNQGTQEVSTNGTSEDFVVTPEEGYGVENITCTNNQIVNQIGETFKVTKVTSDTKCNIKISKKHVITARVEANGTVSPEEQLVTPSFNSEEFVVKPNNGYILDTVTCDNNQATIITKKNTFKLIGVTHDSNCIVTLVEGKTFDNIIKTNNTTIFNDAGALRYVGKQPDNYVWFNCDDYSGTMDETNCEKWRIIGLFKSVTKPSGGTEDLVKIIRADIIGKISWDKPEFNSWSNATLQKGLNGPYLNGTDDTWITSDEYTYSENTIANNYKSITSATKNMIEQVSWNTGGSSTEAITALQWYTYERNSHWNGYIGLMVPSDYGYATSGGSSKNRSTCLDYPLYNWPDSGYQSDCAGQSWLAYTGWLLSPFYSQYYSNRTVFSIAGTRVFGNSWSGAAYDVRPVLYLKSKVGIKSGEETGSAESPYALVPALDNPVER